jgi:hypothetical protein
LLLLLGVPAAAPAAAPAVLLVLYLTNSLLLAWFSSFLLVAAATGAYHAEFLPKPMFLSVASPLHVSSGIVGRC